MRPDTELKGSLRLMWPWGRPQLFITSAEHSASALARAYPLLDRVDCQRGAWCFHWCVGEGSLRVEPLGRVQPRPDTWLARQG